jgi:adenylyltransferase/sulfurtransferase
MTLTQDERTRYERQIPEIGEQGQERLSLATVFVAGAGGLGSHALTALAAAGLGTLRIADPDTVELGNLNRQVLHHTPDVGRPKVDSAAEKLHDLNPHVSVERIAKTLTASNARALIEGSDLVVDATDNLEARFLLNRAAVDLAIPLVHGAVRGFEGRALTVIPGRSACLACMHPSPPAGETFPVVGSAPALIGVIQANEAIKCILGTGDLLADRLLVYDGLKATFTEFRLERNPGCTHCGHLEAR